jgi:hypothetical protein
MKFKIFNLTNSLILLTILGVWYATSQVISPFLHYHLQQIAFITGKDFFHNFSDTPGGIADYCAEFIAQFFYFNSFGSFLIVAVASIQGLLVMSIVQKLIGNIKFRFGIFALVLIFGVVVFFNYRYPYYITVRLLFAFIFTWIFYLLHHKFPKYSVIYWFIFAVLLFYTASGPALFIFSISAVFLYLINNKQGSKWMFIPAFIISGGLLPYLGFKFIFQISLENAYKISIMKPPAMLAYSPDISLYLYYLLLPAVLFGAFIFSMLPGKVKDPSENIINTAPKIKFFRLTPFIVLIQFAACMLIAYFLYFKYYDPLKKNLLTVEYYSEHEQWVDVLKTTKNIKKYDFRVNFHGTRALAHLGQLSERIFEYPQLLGTYGLFIDANMARSAAMPMSDLFFDLGFISESQHWAYEAQTLLPNSPRILKRLVMINLVNRKYTLANEFLEILDKNMLYHDWVARYQRYIADTTLANKDILIAEKRSYSPVKTEVFISNEEGLKLLLETNRNNRMAFDYLMCYLILDLNLPEFVKYLEYCKDYKIKKLPRSWEEALSIYVVKAKSFPAGTSPEDISKTCMQRFKDFNKLINKFKDNIPAGKSSAYMEFGDTYWYYFVYLNPKVTNVLKDKTQIQ